MKQRHFRHSKRRTFDFYGTLSTPRTTMTQSRARPLGPSRSPARALPKRSSGLEGRGIQALPRCSRETFRISTHLSKVSSCRPMLSEKPVDFGNPQCYLWRCWRGYRFAWPSLSSAPGCGVRHPIDLLLSLIWITNTAPSSRYSLSVPQPHESSCLSPQFRPLPAGMRIAQYL